MAYQFSVGDIVVRNNGPLIGRRAKVVYVDYHKVEVQYLYPPSEYFKRPRGYALYQFTLDTPKSVPYDPNQEPSTDDDI